MTTNDKCIVHSETNASEFHRAVNQLRREKKFHADIYQQLPDRCCSCDGQTKMQTLDLMILRKICHEILLSWAFTVHVPFTKNLNKLVLAKRSKSKKTQLSKNDLMHECYGDEDYFVSHRYRCNMWRKRIDKLTYIMSRPSIPLNRNRLHEMYPITLGNFYYGTKSVEQNTEISEDLMSLPFGSLRNLYDRRTKLGLFIGINGRHVRTVQTNYNIHVNMVTESSSAQLRQKLDQLLSDRGIAQNYGNNELYLTLTKTNTSTDETFSFDEVKQMLIEKWNKIDKSEHLKKSVK